MTRRRRYLRALAHGLVAGALYAVGVAVGSHVTEQALVRAYERGIVRGWASCLCWEVGR